jgi:hypothetical protein
MTSFPRRCGESEASFYAHVQDARWPRWTLRSLAYAPSVRALRMLGSALPSDFLAAGCRSSPTRAPVLAAALPAATLAAG